MTIDSLKYIHLLDSLNVPPNLFQPGKNASFFASESPGRLLGAGTTPMDSRKIINTQSLFD